MHRTDPPNTPGQRSAGLLDPTGAEATDLWSVPWTIGDAIRATALMIAGTLVILALSRPLSAAVGLEERAFLAPWLAALLGVLMVTAVWFVAVRKYSVKWGSLGLRAPRARRSFVLPWLAVLASLGFASVYAAVVTAAGADLLEPMPIPEDLLGSGVPRLFNSLIIVLWGPFTEELFFRGFLLTALVPAMGTVRAAGLSSAIFAGAHLALGALAPIFMTGLLLSWLYIKTRSLWPPVMAHALQNLLAVSVAA